MTRYMTIFAAMTFVSAGAFAQDNPFSGGTKMLFGMVKGNLIKAAEKMPEENYSFKPTPEMRSYGALIGHIIDAQYSFCSAVKGEKKGVNAEKSITAKADLVKAMNDSVSYCDAVYNEMTDAAAAGKLKLFGRDWTKLGVLEFNVVHDNEEYGYLSVYLRLKGIVPPSSDRSGH